MAKAHDRKTSTSTTVSPISPASSVDTDLDATFMHHYRYNLSRILSLAQGEHNPYIHFISGMANQRRALMHALLGLSGSHLARQTSSQEMETRACYHLDFAITDLRKTSEQYLTAQKHVEDAAIAQALVIFLKCVIAPSDMGKYCRMLDFVRHVVIHQGACDEGFQGFLVDFILTYDVANAVVSLSHRPSLQAEVVQRAKQITTPTGAYLGILDGLTIHLSRITSMRDSIRSRRAQGLPVQGDPAILREAASIDSDLMTWQSTQPTGSDGNTLSQLYRYCTWIYLYRTLLPPTSDPRLRDAVDSGIKALSVLKADSSAQAMLLMPLYLLGCGAYELSQRPPIDAAFGNLASYRQCANVTQARDVVHRLWKMMDAGNESSWDWESFTSDRGLDWLVV